MNDRTRPQRAKKPPVKPLPAAPPVPLAEEPDGQVTSGGCPLDALADAACAVMHAHLEQLYTPGINFLEEAPSRLRFINGGFSAS